MEKPKFVYVTFINTTPEKLWAAITEPEFTQQYYGGRKIQSDWAIGSPIEFIQPDGTTQLVGEVLQIDRPRLMSCTFIPGPVEGIPDEEPSRLTYQIEVVAGITRLTVTHEGFEPNSPMMAFVIQGWQAIFSSLKSLLETGKPLPFIW